MNFLSEFNYGQEGGNRGLDMGPGLANLNKAINGLQKKMMIGVASSPKVGKSTLTDYAFVIHPWLDALKKGIDFRVIYFSFEMDRITKEFDFTSYFLYHDHHIKGMRLPPGVTYDGNSVVPLSADLLRGRILDDRSEPILSSNELKLKMVEVYNHRIIPLFGEWDDEGKRIKPGVIIFDEHIENPTGLYNKMLAFAETRGVFQTREFRDAEGKIRSVRTHYKPNDQDEFILVIYDTIRKVAPERGFNVKQSVDKMLEYSTIVKKLCGWSFIPIIHINRDMADSGNAKMFSDRLYPTPEMIKDTGNISEECNHLVTLFNPYDDRYNLKQHFGKNLRHPETGAKIYPGLRTIHLVESRQVVYPQHFRVQMEGNIKNFNQFID